jgi:hypothetical protein
MIEHYLYLYHMCFILSDLKCYGVRRKMSNEKLMRKKKLYNLQNMFLKIYWTPLIFKPHNFLIFIHFKQFKVV